MSSTKPHEEALMMDFTFVTLRAAWWMTV